MCCINFFLNLWEHSNHPNNDSPICLSDVIRWASLKEDEQENLKQK